MNKLCVGLFGTCGNSTWRNPFMEKYKSLEINFYNPQIEDWTPECSKEEAEHLASDCIILFPVLDETYAFGSLAEVGFSILQTLRLDDKRDLIVLITDHLSEELMKDEIQAKESLKSRALVYQHLKKIRSPNVYLVNTLDEMLDLSIKLYENHKRIRPFRKRFNPHLREY